MMNLLNIFLLSIPLIVGGILHMLVVKLDVLSTLKKPIHLKAFGANKTWRGFVVMPLLTWPGVVLAQLLDRSLNLRPLVADQSSFLLALLLGTAYCLSELPNSYMKRRLGIKEGQTADQWKWIFVIIDQADSAIGCLLAYMLVVNISWDIFLATVVFGIALHLLLNVFLYQIGVRRNPY
jgi:CDP-archaeol synthase